MKRLIYLAWAGLGLLWALPLAVLAQTSHPDLTRLEYFFDTDPGVGLATPLAFPADTVIDQTYTLPVSSLSNGFHVLGMRAKDENGRWSVVHHYPFLKENISPTGNAALTKGEYFFDNDPGYGQGIDIPFTAGPAIDISFTAGIGSLSNGFHTLYVRFKDENGLWSLMHRQAFLKEAVSTTTLPQLAKLEYFFDTDPGYGQGTAIPLAASASADISFTADLNGLQPGFHVLYLRARDASKGWSLLNTKVFLMEDIAPGQSVNLIAAEYYVDTDPGYGQGTPIPVTPGPTQDLNAVVDLSNVSNGFHTVYIRVKNETGQWSITNYKSFWRENNSVSAALPNITGLRYYITQAGGAVAQPAQTYSGFVPATSADVTFDPTTCISAPGDYYLRIQGIDGNGTPGLDYVHPFTFFGNSAPTRVVQTPDAIYPASTAQQLVVAAPSVFDDADLVNGDSLAYSAQVLGTLATAFVDTDLNVLLSTGPAQGADTLVIYATDRCGNQATDTVAFMVNVPAQLATGGISPLSYCHGGTVTVPYTATGTYNPGNTFTAQLSDASGSFASPTPIGSVTATETGIITATLPTGIAGAHYRIRVVSSDPALDGANNGVDIAIRATPTTANAGPAQTLCASATALAANLPTVGTGSWSVVSGTGSFSSASDPATQVNGLSVGPNVFRWTIANAPCPASESEVTITRDPDISVANAGSDQSVCGATVTLSATVPAVGTGSWQLISGSGTIAASGSAVTSVTGLGMGDNVFAWTITGGTCPPTTDEVTITRYAVPALPLASSNSPLCAGQSLTLSASGSGSATYSWSGPLGFASVQQHPVLTNTSAAQTGTYSVRATENGCSSAWSTVAVVINTEVNTPVATAGSPVCSGQTLQLTASAVAGATYSWTGPNGFTSTDQNPAIPSAAVANTGNYTVFAQANGCVSEGGVVPVVVNATPAAPVVSSNSPLCEGHTLYLSSNQVANATYSWVGPDNFSAGTQHAQLQNAPLTATGIYNLFVTVNGCTSAAGAVAVTVNSLLPAPTVSANGPLCEGQNLQLSATSLSGATYNWTGPESFTSSLQHPGVPAVSVANAGTYTVVATLNGCPSEAAMVQVVVNEIPGAPLAGSNSPICANQVLMLNASAATGASYSWVGPNGFTSSDQNPQVNNAASGTYSVFAVLNGCTSAAGTVAITVTPLQDAAFAYTGSSFCKTGTNPLPTVTGGTSGTFAATPAGLVFTAANTGEIDLALSAAGTYSITFTTAGPCPGSSSQTVTIANPPSAAFSYGGPYCQQPASALPTLAGGAVAGTFSASPAGLVLLNAATGEVDLQTSVPGTYTVTNTLAAANGCAAVTAGSQIAIKATPAVTAANGGPVCAGQPVTLSATAPAGATFAWNGPDGFSAVTQFPVIDPVGVASAGEYTVTATVNGCASAPATTTLVVNTTVATPGIGNSGPVCEGNPVQLSAGNVSGATYSWAGPGGFSSTDQNPLLNNPTAAASGNYSVFAVENGCVSVAAVTAVVVNPVPAQPTLSYSPVCNGQTLFLTASSNAGAAYTWSGPNGFSSAQQFPQISSASAANEGVYSATATLSGCASTAGTLAVTVTPLPAVTASASAGTICAGTSVMLSGFGAGSYSWSGVGLGATSGQTVTATPATAGTYTYAVTGTQNGCQAQVQVVVTVDPCLCPGTPPAFSFTGNPNHTASAVSPAIGAPSETYHFEIVYTDADGDLPAPGFPKLFLDFEGDGNYTGPSDLALTLIGQNPADTDVTDGKVYYANMPGLPVSNNWNLRFLATDAAGCTGQFDTSGPDVVVAPDLAIYASDISFSSANPAVSSTQVVTAVVRNNSTTAVQNFVVRLINHADLSATYPDVTVPSLSANGSASVSWTIQTPAAAGWIPMQVVVDQTNLIAESNELNNQAIRPFINGDFTLSGTIEIDAEAIPDELCSQPGQYFSICGEAIYQNTAVPLTDPSVAGATVTIVFPQTGQTYSGLTNSAGQFCIGIPAPIAVGNYTYQISITDYTLTGTGTAALTITPPCPPAVPNGPDLAACYSGANSVFEGGTLTGVVIVSNTGNEPSAATTLNVAVTNGSPATWQFAVPALAANDTVHLPLPAITNNGLGYMAIATSVDPQLQVTELNENNNHCVSQIQVCPTLPNLTAAVSSGAAGYFCHNSTTFRVLNNSCVPVNVPFQVQALVYENSNLIGTYSQTVTTGVGVNNETSVTFQNLFPAPGNYLVEFTTDAAGQIAELNETDNQWTGGFVISECRPDLSITSCNTVQPVNPGSGNLDISATLYNGGNATALAPFTVTLNLNGNLYPVTVNSNVAPNASAQVTVTVPNPPGTCAAATFLADSGLEIAEFNESNNTSSVQLFYDFAPVSLCGATMFWEYAHPVGQPVQLGVGLANSGGFRASQVQTKFEVTGPGITGWLNLGFATNNNVQQTCFCPYGASLPQPYIFPQAGIYTVRMTADANNVYPECNEGNNVLIVQVAITNLPNYRVLSQYIAPSLLNPDIGEPISITATYQNLGAASVTDSLNLSVLVNDVLFETKRVKGLGAGQTHSVLLDGQWSSTLTGVHVIRTVIDSGNEIPEGNETDNEATRAIVVGETANLLFAQFTPATYNPGLGSLLTLAAEVENAGPVDTEADVQFFYLNNAGDTILFYQQYVAVQANSSQTLNVPWTVTDASTTLIGRIVNSTIIESDYTDNSASALIGGMSLAFASSPACANADNGTAWVTVTGGVAPFTYQWSNGGATEDVSGAPGTYTVNVTDASGISVSGSVVIDALAVPALAVSASALQICAGESVSLTASGAENYTWSNGMSGSVIVVSPGATASYTVTASSAEGCTADSVVTITVVPAVTATASANSPLTEGDALLLTASGGSSYTWSGPNGFSSSLQNPVHANAPLAASGTYTVVASNGLCSDTAFVAVVVNAITAPPCTTALNGSYTINAALPTAGTNFQSFAAAAQALNTIGVCGPVVIHVVQGSGPYTGQLVLQQIPGASAVNTVTINGNGETLSRCSNKAGILSALVYLNGTDYLTIDGMVLNATCGKGTGFYLTGGTEHIMLSHNVVNLPQGASAGNYGLFASAPGGLTFVGNQITGGRRGIQVANSVGVVTLGMFNAAGTGPANAMGNTITNSYEYGINLINASNVTVSHNTVTMLSGPANIGVNVNQLANFAFESNLIINAGRIGIRMNQSGGGTLTNNRIGLFQAASLQAIGVYMANTNGVSIYHNSFWANAGSQYGFGLRILSGSSAMDVRKNIFAINTTVGVPLYSSQKVFSQLSHNVYFRSTPGNLATIPKAIPTLATLNAYGFSSVGSFATEDPGFSIGTGFDDAMRTTNGTLADVATAAVLVFADFEGDVRQAGTVDLGADEIVTTARQIRQQLKAAVYPNPFSSSLTVRLTDAQAGNVQVVLTDLMGRQIISRSYGVEAGAASLSVEVTEQLAQGVYLLQVRQGQATSTFRVVKH